ncbi:HJR/Mrr/RecB family endonuclease [Bacillus niacini]|uniref:HJR/Mrr/RecB family endonuclease n=1 Tax=Neobacillus niacini TaxID=86668 RepID=A0A852TLB3_9BACI|nr:restriction endonuclease [Neobacillus niacini]NYE07854.1 HJR/Mrr/RecB family endonuclease [Neobacillus niacini]
MGYTGVELTQVTGDKGVDIIAYKNSKKIAIQCKRYDAKLTNTAIQQVFSGQHIYKCDEACVITNSFFTEQAIDDARKLQVRLIDRKSLFNLTQQANDLAKLPQ